MDHLIQIPQVGTAWEPIPEPWVTLGLLAGLDTRPAARHPGHPGDLPPAGDHRQDGRHPRRALRRPRLLRRRRRLVGARAPRLRAAVPAARRAPRPARDGDRDDAGAVGHRHQTRTTGSGSPCPRPRATRGRSTTCRCIVGGAGERRTLRIAARLGDGCNVPVDVVEEKTAVLRRHCEEVGRDPAEVAVTVLDLPVVGRDRDDVWERVERLRGPHGCRDVRPAPPRGHARAAPRPLPGARGARRGHRLRGAAGPGPARGPAGRRRDAALTEGCGNVRAG